MFESRQEHQQLTGRDLPAASPCRFCIKNVKSSKLMQIMQELGQRPVVAFGNSTGDDVTLNMEQTAWTDRMLDKLEELRMDAAA